MIVGIGVDVVELARFERAATRTPALLPRLFAESERRDGGRELAFHSLAARFAAKEALIKAIGHSDGIFWHDMRIVSDANGRPSFETHRALRAHLDERGITRIHVSMTHDAGMAIAYVIAESSSGATA